MLVRENIDKLRQIVKDKSAILLKHTATEGNSPTNVGQKKYKAKIDAAKQVFLNVLDK